MNDNEQRMEVKIWICYCGSTIVPAFGHEHAKDCRIARARGYGIVEV